MIRRERLWPASTVALLVTGYAGYYLCRSNLSVSMPLITEELAAIGVDPASARVQLGSIASLGVLAYAFMKLPGGGLADRIGGRNNFLIGMGGSVVFTALFALSGSLPLFTLAWIGNRAVQSLGWAGIVRVVSRWFAFSSYGTVMGLISLSYLFGDAAARQFMSLLIGSGFGWRDVFGMCAAVLGVAFVVTWLALRENPGAVGLPEPPANPSNVFGTTAAGSESPSIVGLFLPLLRNRMFWIVCALSLGLTLVRETFNLWTPTYFAEVLSVSGTQAASYSALFPLFGGFSVVVAGLASDRIGAGGRSLVMFVGLALAGAAQMILSLTTHAITPAAAMVLVSTVAFLLIGPYSYLAGAISLDFGGKKGSATASGLIDGIGYLGGALSGLAMGQVSVTYGWSGAFLVLAVVTWMAAAAALMYCIADRRQAAVCGPVTVSATV